MRLPTQHLSRYLLCPNGKVYGTAYEALYGYLVSCHTCVRYCDGSKYEERLDREALRK